MALAQRLGSGSSKTKLLLHLDGNVTDSSGNAVSCTATNVTYANGYAGSQAASFNGSSSKIAFSEGNSYAAITIAVTYNATTYTGTKVLFMANNQNYFCQIEATGRINFATQTSGYNYLQSATGVVSTGVKHRAVFRYTGSTKNIFIDGKSVANVGSLSGSIPSGGTTKIGVYNDDSYGWWSGLQDEFQIDNFAWSDSDVIKDNTFRRAMLVL